jgi:SAM-dependent methyltransferase
MTHQSFAATEPGPLPPLSIHGWLRYDVVERILDELQPRTALEIGCGQGAFGSRLARTTEYLGVEPDHQSWSVARDRVVARGGEVLEGTHAVVPGGASFDLVCAFEVLEHIEDDIAALADWVRFVRPGGHLLLSVPAFQERFGPMDTYAGHYRRYSPDQIRERLIDSGLTEVRTTLYGWPLAYPLERLRNRIDARKVARARDLSPDELTSASGRTFQPRRRSVGAVVAASVWPFRLLQRARPRTGTGLVVVARRPE